MKIKNKSALAVAAVVPLFLGSTAGATSLPNNLAQSQAIAQIQISNRITRLDNLTNRVNISLTITASDRSALLAIYGNSSTGDIADLNALSAKVATETTVSGVQTDLHTLYSTYRIYAVVAPQSDLVLAADTETSVINVMTGLEPGLSAIIKSGGSTSAATADYNQYLADISAAQTDVGSISSQALGLTPALFNQDRSGTITLIQSDWKSIKAGQASLLAARAEIDAIITSAG